MTWLDLVQLVRDRGRYDTDEEAEDVLRAVLVALGAQLIGEERRDLAAVLPHEARAIFAAQIPLTEPLKASVFVDGIARTLHATSVQGRWHTSSVLTALGELTGRPLIDRILAQLPSGYALLFCRADLAAAA